MKTKVLKSSAMRLALSLCGLFALSVLLMFGIAFHEAEEDLGKHMVSGLVELKTTLLAVYRQQGFMSLKQQIDVLSIGAQHGETLLFLTDDTGNPVAGNVDQMDLFTGWKTVPFEDITFKKRPASAPDAYVSFGSGFPEGALIIGRNNSEISKMRFGIFESLSVGLAASLAMTVLTGLMLARRNDRRLRDIEATLDRTANGDLSDRVPVSSGIGDDLTRVSNSINATLARLEATVESYRQVSFDIAHELKTPLQRLRQKLEILAANENLDEGSHNEVDLIIAETNEIITTFQALLRISQIEGGSRKSQFQPVNMLDLVQRIIDIFTPVAEDHGHHLELATVENNRNVTIFGDTELLTQMITNIVENAIRHCPEPAKIKLSLYGQDEHLFLEVSDNGPGIPAQERLRVMERLYRLEKSRTTPGSGLGLSLVKAVADLHGFKISLDDDDPGLRIIIQLT